MNGTTKRTTAATRPMHITIIAGIAIGIVGSVVHTQECAAAVFAGDSSGTAGDCWPNSARRRFGC